LLQTLDNVDNVLKSSSSNLSTLSLKYRNSYVQEFLAKPNRQQLTRYKEHL